MATAAIDATPTFGRAGSVLRALPEEGDVPFEYQFDPASGDAGGGDVADSGDGDDVVQLDNGPRHVVFSQLDDSHRDADGGDGDDGVGGSTPLLSQAVSREVPPQPLRFNDDDSDNGDGVRARQEMLQQQQRENRFGEHKRTSRSHSLAEPPATPLSPQYVIAYQDQDDDDNDGDGAGDAAENDGAAEADGEMNADGTRPDEYVDGREDGGGGGGGDDDGVIGDGEVADDDQTVVAVGDEDAGREALDQDLEPRDAPEDEQSVAHVDTPAAPPRGDDVDDGDGHDGPRTDAENGDDGVDPQSRANGDDDIVAPTDAATDTRHIDPERERRREKLAQRQAAMRERERQNRERLARARAADERAESERRRAKERDERLERERIAERERAAKRAERVRADLERTRAACEADLAVVDARERRHLANGRSSAAAAAASNGAREKSRDGNGARGGGDGDGDTPVRKSRRKKNGALVPNAAPLSASDARRDEIGRLVHEQASRANRPPPPSPVRARPDPVVLPPRTPPPPPSLSPLPTQLASPSPRAVPPSPSHSRAPLWRTSPHGPSAPGDTSSRSRRAAATPLLSSPAATAAAAAAARFDTRPQNRRPHAPVSDSRETDERQRRPRHRRTRAPEQDATVVDRDDTSDSVRRPATEDQESAAAAERERLDDDDGQHQPETDGRDRHGSLDEDDGGGGGDNDDAAAARRGGGGDNDDVAAARRFGKSLRNGARTSGRRTRSRSRATPVHDAEASEYENDQSRPNLSSRDDDGDGSDHHHRESSQDAGVGDDTAEGDEIFAERNGGGGEFVEEKAVEAEEVENAEPEAAEDAESGRDGETGRYGEFAVEEHDNEFSDDDDGDEVGDGTSTGPQTFADDRERERSETEDNGDDDRRGGRDRRETTPSGGGGGGGGDSKRLAERDAPRSDRRSERANDGRMDRVAGSARTEPRRQQQQSHASVSPRTTPSSSTTKRGSGLSRGNGDNSGGNGGARNRNQVRRQASPLRSSADELRDAEPAAEDDEDEYERRRAVDDDRLDGAHASPQAGFRRPSEVGRTATTPLPSPSPSSSSPANVRLRRKTQRPSPLPPPPVPPSRGASGDAPQRVATDSADGGGGGGGDGGGDGLVRNNGRTVHVVATAHRSDGAREKKGRPKKGGAVPAPAAAAAAATRVENQASVADGSATATAPAPTPTAGIATVTKTVTLVRGPGDQAIGDHALMRHHERLDKELQRLWKVGFPDHGFRLELATLGEKRAEIEFGNEWRKKRTQVNNLKNGVSLLAVGMSAVSSVQRRELVVVEPTVHEQDLRDTCEHYSTAERKATFVGQIVEASANPLVSLLGSVVAEWFKDAAKAQTTATVETIIRHSQNTDALEADRKRRLAAPPAPPPGYYDEPPTAVPSTPAPVVGRRNPPGSSPFVAPHTSPGGGGGGGVRGHAVDERGRGRGLAFGRGRGAAAAAAAARGRARGDGGVGGANGRGRGGRGTSDASGRGRGRGQTRGGHAAATGAPGRSQTNAFSETAVGRQRTATDSRRRPADRSDQKGSIQQRQRRQQQSRVGYGSEEEEEEEEEEESEEKAGSGVATHQGDENEYATEQVLESAASGGRAQIERDARREAPRDTPNRASPTAAATRDPSSVVSVAGTPTSGGRSAGATTPASESASDPRRSATVSRDSLPHESKHGAATATTVHATPVPSSSSSPSSSPLVHDEKDEKRAPRTSASPPSGVATLIQSAPATLSPMTVDEFLLRTRAPTESVRPLGPSDSATHDASGRRSRAPLSVDDILASSVYGRVPPRVQVPRSPLVPRAAAVVADGR